MEMYHGNCGFACTCYSSRLAIIRASAKLIEEASRRYRLREFRQPAPFIYITHCRNVDNREIDITVVPARDVARCPLYRAFAYKHTPTNNTAVCSLHSNALTPRGLNRRDTPTSPDSRSVFAFTDVLAVCSPPPIGESRGERASRENAAECTNVSAWRRFSGSYRPF